MADLPTAFVQPVSLSGETWTRLKQAVAGLPVDKRYAIIAAATYDHATGKPKADALLTIKARDGWYVVGSLGYAPATGGSASVAVMVTG